jgi:hypothetical protein
MYVVVVGNPFDGMTIYGPFDGPTEADEWTQGNAKTDLDGVDWWIMPLESPVDDETLRSEEDAS